MRTAINRTVRPLLIAEAANPEWVSVPLVGWSLSNAIQRITGGHIVTQIRNREAFLRSGLSEGEEFTAIDSEATARLVWKLSSALRMGEGKGWTTVTALQSLAYPYFERLVWQRFSGDLKAGRFNLVHRITPLSPTVASPMAQSCRTMGVPFIIGPLNGGLPWPVGFDSERRREREWLSYVRGLYKLLPGRHRTLSAAAAIIVGSRHTLSEIPKRYREKCVYIPENAIDPKRFSLTPKERPSKPLRGCFIGRLVPYKGPDMLIEAAVPLLQDGLLRLDIIGDGPLMSELQALTERHGVGKAIRFFGWVPHEQLQFIAREADIFAYPSIREFGGAVVLEAMFLGVAPIVIDYGGPGEYVTKSTGFKVPLGSRRDIVEALRALLSTLVASPDSLREVGHQARARIEEKYTWARKAEQVCAVYGWALGKHADRPCPFGEG